MFFLSGCPINRPDPSMTCVYPPPDLLANILEAPIILYGSVTNVSDTGRRSRAELDKLGIFPAKLVSVTFQEAGSLRGEATAHGGKVDEKSLHPPIIFTQWQFHGVATSGEPQEISVGPMLFPFSQVSVVDKSWKPLWNCWTPGLELDWLPESPSAVSNTSSFRQDLVSFLYASAPRGKTWPITRRRQLAVELAELAVGPYENAKALKTVYRRFGHRSYFAAMVLCAEYFQCNGAKQMERGNQLSNKERAEISHYIDLANSSEEQVVRLLRQGDIGGLYAKMRTHSWKEVEKILSETESPKLARAFKTYRHSLASKIALEAH